MDCIFSDMLLNQYIIKNSVKGKENTCFLSVFLRLGWSYGYFLGMFIQVMQLKVNKRNESRKKEAQKKLVSLKALWITPKLIKCTNVCCFMLQCPTLFFLWSSKSVFSWCLCFSTSTAKNLETLFIYTCVFYSSTDRQTEIKVEQWFGCPPCSFCSATVYSVNVTQVTQFFFWHFWSSLLEMLSVCGVWRQYHCDSSCIVHVVQRNEFYK